MGRVGRRAGGWLAFTDEGVIVNHFDELNGATAKTRMVTAKHVAHHRNVGATVTQAALQEKYSSVTLKADDHISPGSVFPITDPHLSSGLSRIC